MAPHVQADVVAMRGFAESIAELVGTSRVTFALGDRSAEVDLARLAVRRIRRERYVCLADLWVASGLQGDLVDLAFEFVSDGGARDPRPPGDGALLAHGYLHAGTRDLMWDGAVCAYRVRRVAVVVAQRVGCNSIVTRALSR